MSRPLLLDLFCGAGGAAKGYHDAGFDVVGVDINPQPRYPYEFERADAMAYPLQGFDAVHASPPCQDHSDLVHRNPAHGTGWMLAATIERLDDDGRPYVIENVDSADMPGSLVLCGSEFGLGAAGKTLRRHRQFLSKIFMMGAGGCTCSGWPIGGVYGTGGADGKKFGSADARTAMGIDWMTRAELSQAIPPAYTRFVGEQLLAAIQVGAS